MNEITVKLKCSIAEIQEIIRNKNFDIESSYILDDTYGDIANQEKVDCEVTDIEEARKFIETIGYKRLMNIRENGIIFTNGEIEILVKDIVNRDNLAEIELAKLLKNKA